jgi:hypothetical protein
MQFKNYADAIRFAIDCSVEVENKFYGFKSFDGTFDYGEAMISLGSLDCDEDEDEDSLLTEKLKGYREIVEMLQECLSDAQCVLDGLEVAHMFKTEGVTG